MQTPRLWRESIAPVLIAIVVVGLTVGLAVATVISYTSADKPQAKLSVVPKAAEFEQGPTGVAPNVTAPTSVLQEQREQVEQGTYDTSGVLRGAAAEPARITCLTRMNGGKRKLTDIGLMVAHVTVSLNVPGLFDLNSLCAFFRRVKASPTWTVDNEGNSSLNVPLRKVPWTQAWFNRPSCSAEYVGSTGRPKEGLAQWTDRQLKEGGRLFAKCARLAGIPVRNARVSGTTGRIYRTGFITHEELGVKGGGHTDPGPKFNRARQLYWIKYFVIRATKPTDVDRVTCRKLRWWRANGRPKGLALKRAEIRKAALAKRSIVCRRAGPVRA